MFLKEIMNENLVAARLSVDDHGRVCFPDLKICASRKCTSFIHLHKLIVWGTAEEFLHFIMSTLDSLKNSFLRYSCVSEVKQSWWSLHTEVWKNIRKWLIMHFMAHTVVPLCIVIGSKSPKHKDLNIGTLLYSRIFPCLIKKVMTTPCKLSLASLNLVINIHIFRYIVCHSSARKVLLTWRIK